MVKQFVSFERLAQYDELIKKFISSRLTETGSDISAVWDAINGTGEGSVQAQINKAFNDFLTEEGAENVIDSYKDLLDYVKDNPEFANVVADVKNLKDSVGAAATDTTMASGLFKDVEDLKNDTEKAIDDLKNLELNVSSDPEGDIVVELGGTVSDPTLVLTYEFCTEQDINDLFTLKTIKVGDKEYSSVEKALADLEQGGTLTLIDNLEVDKVGAITVNGEATLDLNGKTVKTSTPQAVYVTDVNTRSVDGPISTFAIEHSELVITGNGTFEGPQNSTAALNDGKSMMTVEGQNATLIVENGTVTVGGENSDGMYGIYALDGATVILGKEGSIDGPVIKSWFAALGENNTTSPVNVKIYGGKYTALAAPADGDWWHYFCAPVYASAAGTIEIYGGQFNGYYALSSRYDNVDQTIKIYDGEFNGAKSALFVDTVKGSYKPEGTRTIEIYGGSFSSDVSDYCAEGYECVLEGGQFKVRAKSIQ